MGQHKHNPTAIAAKEGKLPPKPKKMSKRERDRWLYARCQEAIYRRLLGTDIKTQTEELK